MNRLDTLLLHEFTVNGAHYLRAARVCFISLQSCPEITPIEKAYAAMVAAFIDEALELLK